MHEQCSSLYSFKLQLCHCS